jgi:hypothetical protein
MVLPRMAQRYILCRGHREIRHEYKAAISLASRLNNVSIAGGITSQGAEMRFESWT